MITIKSDKIIFVDVDDTLVLWSSTSPTYTPHHGHILMLKKFKARGHKIVVWSAGGWEWANKIVNELGLELYVDIVMSKPAWFIDDLPSSVFMPEVNRIYKEPFNVVPISKVKGQLSIYPGPNSGPSSPTKPTA